MTCSMKTETNKSFARYIVILIVTQTYVNDCLLYFVNNDKNVCKKKDV